MGKTVLQLVQSACYSAGFTSVPTGLASATAFAELQLLQLFYDTGEELRAMRCWPQLQKKHFIDLVPGRREYQLPLDFYGYIPFAGMDQRTSWPLDGYLIPSEWNYRLFGYVTTENRKAFRVFGPDINPSSAGGQFVIDPVPGDAEAGLRLTIEYVSKSWLCPPLWTSGTSFGANTYCFCGGNVYQKGSGSANCGTVPLSMARGEGQDGGVRWTVFSPSAWGSGTLYQAGTYVTNDGGKLYVCTVGGTSAGSGGPTGSASGSITDNTCTWEYRSTSAWAGQTSYAIGDIVTASGRYYRCTNPPGSTNIKSGSVTPTWAVSSSDFTQSDGTITWTHKPAAYTAIQLDTDLCLFDDELMQLGLRYRFLESKGLLVQAMSIKKQYDAMRDAALGRWNGSRKVSLADGGPLNRAYPNVPEGSFTF